MSGKDKIIATSVYLRQDFPAKKYDKSKDTYLKDGPYPLVHTSKKEISQGVKDQNDRQIDQVIGYKQSSQ